jgi:hypothetical protein
MVLRQVARLQYPHWETWSRRRPCHLTLPSCFRYRHSASPLPMLFLEESNVVTCRSSGDVREEHSINLLSKLFVYALYLFAPALLAFNTATVERQKFPLVLHARPIMDRTGCFIFLIAILLGHILVFGVRGQSPLRRDHVTQYLTAAVVCIPCSNDLVETLRDRGLNTKSGFCD